MIVIVQSGKRIDFIDIYRPNGRVRGSRGVILKYATLEQAVYPPDHTDLSDVSTIKELISLHFSCDSLSAKVTSIDGAFPNETD